MGDELQSMMEDDPQKAAAKLANLQNMVNDALRATFRPEFLNRIDDIVTFDELTIADMEPIVDLQLADVRKRLADRRVTLDITTAAREALAIDGYDPVFGARPLKRLIQREVVDRIAEQVVRGNVLEYDHVLIDVSPEGSYECKVEKPLDVDLDDLAADLDDWNL